jgi:release factor glutamine methyltransferase
MTLHDEPWTIRRLLEWTTGFFTRKKVDPPRLSAEQLLAHVLGVSRIKLYTDYERVLSDEQLKSFRALVQRSGEQEPIAYLTGKAHFFNLEFEVTRDVLIPRPDTETLVEHAMQLIRGTPGWESPRVLDLCTGSGCIACAIAHHVKSATVTATELSERAAEVASKNVERLQLGGRVIVAQGDLYEPLAALPDVGPFHLILSNPPYIASGQIAKLDRSVKDYEPTMALDGGPDGLSFHRRILDGAAERLLPGGTIYLEIAYDHGDAARELITHYPQFENGRILKDYGGNERVLPATRKE